MPRWVDLPAGRVFSKNANKSGKAFALVGQRVYITGVSRRALSKLGLDWELALQACGASAVSWRAWASGASRPPASARLPTWATS